MTLVLYDEKDNDYGYINYFKEPSYWNIDVLIVCFFASPGDEEDRS